MHSNTPINVGRIKAIIVHFILPVSFFIVKQVVEHGKWNKDKSMKLIAVKIVHPF